MARVKPTKVVNSLRRMSTGKITMPVPNVSTHFCYHSIQFLIMHIENAVSIAREQMKQTKKIPGGIFFFSKRT